MKAVVAAFNQEKALVGAFSVITNLRMELFQALLRRCGGGGETADLRPAGRTEEEQASALRPIESLLLFDKLSKPWTGQSWVRITVSSILTAAGSDRVRGHMGTAGRAGRSGGRAHVAGGGPAPSSSDPAFTRTLPLTASTAEGCDRGMFGGLTKCIYHTY